MIHRLLAAVWPPCSAHTSMWFSLHCRAVMDRAGQYSALQGRAVQQCAALQYCAVQRYSLQCSGIPYRAEECCSELAALRDTVLGNREQRTASTAAQGAVQCAEHKCAVKCRKELYDALLIRACTVQCTGSMLAVAVTPCMIPPSCTKLYSIELQCTALNYSALHYSARYTP